MSTQSSFRKTKRCLCCFPRLPGSTTRACQIATIIGVTKRTAFSSGPSRRSKREMRSASHTCHLCKGVTFMTENPGKNNNKNLYCMTHFVTYDSSSALHFVLDGRFWARSLDLIAYAKSARKAIKRKLKKTMKSEERFWRSRRNGRIWEPNPKKLWNLENFNFNFAKISIFKPVSWPTSPSIVSKPPA